MRYSDQVLRVSRILLTRNGRIPLLVTSLTADLLRQALETVRAQDVEEWLDEHLGPSPQKKKHAVLTAARSSDKNEGPEPA